MTGAAGIAGPSRGLGAGPGRLTLAALSVLLAGCIAGGDGGGDLYAGLTERDVDLAVETLQSALEGQPNGTPARWENTESGNGGAIEPVNAYVTTGGYACRDYIERLRVEGREGRYRNTACRDESGRWVWVG